MKNKNRILPLLGSALSIFSCSLSANAQPVANDNAILMQGFHWHSHREAWYARIENEADSLAALGVNYLWFPPVSDAASSEGYLPRRLYNYNSNYGDKAALSSAVRALKNRGIQSVADLVINHRVGTQDWADFTQPTWDSSAVTCNDEWGQGSGACDSGDGYNAARDLDHSNATVQRDIRTWITQQLFNDIGFSGIRYDYSKGYSPYYAGLYARESQADFCVGEVWTDLDYNNVNAHRQQLMDYVDGTGGVCSAFDFTTKGLLNNALNYGEYYRLANNGQAAGGIGWWPEKMVTFVDNHDTGPSESCFAGQNHWPVYCDKVMQGYAYILTHPGVPSLYWAHVYDWQLYNSIQALVNVRKQQGLNARSQVEILRAENQLYAAIIDNKVAVKLGSRDWSPGADWQLATSGNDYAVWHR